MSTVSEAFARAIEHHRAGRLVAAEQVYRQILNADSTHADTLHMLGLLNAQTSNCQHAAEFFSRAVTIRPDWAEAQANLGNVLREQGNPDEAVTFLRRALELKPDYPAAHNNLGNAYQDRGELEAAIACYRRAVELKSDFAEAHGNLGIALKIQGDLDAAIFALQKAVDLKPGFAIAHFNLGEAFRARGNFEHAIAAFGSALALRPEFVEAANNLGIALGENGRRDEAIAAFRRAISLRPEFAEAHFNLGNTLMNRGDLHTAAICYRRVLELEPDHAQAHNSLGSAFKGQGKLDEAIGCYRRALELGPEFAEAWNNLGNALRDQGDVDDAIGCYRHALELKPDFAVAHSNLLYTLHYCADISQAALSLAHAEFDRQHAALHSRTPAPHQQIDDPHRCLRLGFISPDLGRHPVGYFLVRVLENLNRQEYETVCYSDRLVDDDLTRRLQFAVTRWRDVTTMSDERLAKQVLADQIDILFDLAGHTARNRLLAFARKPAPIQISWIGYEGTTGLATMDYLLADHFMVPDGSERHYREKVLRMPDGYLCFDPPAQAPAVTPPPCLRNGFPTFGSFHNPAKITSSVVAVWAQILGALPTARLIMKYRGLGDAAVRQRFVDRFAAAGVPSEQLEILSWSSYPDYLATYGRVDVALDPFPFSGSTITCESMWMGVPVITWPGETFASRHSLGHLSRVGLKQTIAGNRERYVELAVSWASDPARLTALRSELRDRMAASPLCDGERFAAQLSSVLNHAWKESIGKSR